MALVLITPPPVEPVSLSELKEFLRIDAGDTSQDDTLTALGVTARSWGEVFTKRRFVQQTWRLYMDFFPGYIDLKIAGQKVSSPFVSGSNAVLVGIRYAIMLPYPPVQSIVNFQYQDSNGNPVVMDPATDYVQDLMSNPARLTPPFGRMWPVARVVVNAVQVDYSLGYASPIVVSNSATSKTVTATAYEFQTTDVGRPISIPGAGPVTPYAPAGGVLNTVIAAVPGAPSASATLRDQATTATSDVTALLVNTPSANPAHWSMIKDAIKLYVAGRYEKRLPDAEVQESLNSVLWPVRDLRF